MIETATVKQFESTELTANVLPAEATNKNVTWEVVDAETNVTLTVDKNDSQKVSVKGVFIGNCTVRATAGGFTADCAITVTGGTLNGFSQFENGGLVNNTYYYSDIEMIDCGTTDRVQFKGKGGTNWGDASKTHSTMGGYYNTAVDIGSLEIMYSVDEWVQSGDHWYYIALTSGEKDDVFGNNKESNGTLFFMFAYNNGAVTLNAHYVGSGNDWTNIGQSQGVAATGGQYTIKIEATEDGYSIYMKNAEQSEYTLQNFNGITVLPKTTIEQLFGSNPVYLQAGAYVNTFDGKWAFTLGVNQLK